jgi:pimeloyl-ACP methyl ester carboxylesterase
MRSSPATPAGSEPYVAEHGRGHPLVLLHGGLMTAELTFGPLIPALAERHRVLAVELQGHGHTPDSDRPMALEYLADDLVDVLDRHGLERADVFGFSLGGMVALEFALRHPDRLDRLIVGSVDYRPGAVELPPERLPTEADFQAMRDAYAAVAPDPGHFDDFSVKASGMVHTHPGWTEAQLATVGAPTLLLFGDADFAPLDHAVGLHAAITQSQLAVLPGTTHMEVVRRIDVVLTLVERFLGEAEGDHPSR